MNEYIPTKGPKTAEDLSFIADAIIRNLKEKEMPITTEDIIESFRTMNSDYDDWWARGLRTKAEEFSFINDLISLLNERGIENIINNTFETSKDDILKATIKCTLDDAIMTYAFKGSDGKDYEASLDDFLASICFCDEYTVESIELANEEEISRFHEAEKLEFNEHLCSCYTLGTMTLEECLEEHEIDNRPVFTKDSLKSDLAEKKAAEKDASIKLGHEKNKEQSL